VIRIFSTYDDKRAKASVRKEIVSSITYRKISIIRPGHAFVQKVLLVGLFSGGILLKGVLRFKNGSAYIWKGFCV